MGKFDTVERNKVRKSTMNMSRETKLSGKIGQLYPCFYEEVVPGDHFRVKTEMMLRFAPMLAPIYHRVDASVHYFYVPNRILWSEFETFLTGGQDGLSTPVHPHIIIGQDAIHGSIYDYMGLPTQDPAAPSDLGQMKFSALPFRAYQFIYNEYYRDARLSAEVAWTTDSGKVGATELNELKHIRKRTWEKDYFTTARPEAQLGGEVTIPVTENYRPSSIAKDTAGNPITGFTGIVGDGSGNLQFNPGTVPGRIENLEALNGIEILINDLRTASAVQRLQEALARSGHRFREYLMAIFGVKSKDARLDVPEYLGGGRVPVQISEVLNTTGTVDAPQGDFTGHGISVGTTNQFKYFFPEHGQVIGILSLRPRSGYSQGIPRKFQRFEKLDYYVPQLANLGEQELKTREIWHDFTVTNDPDVSESALYQRDFGYQERYAEMKHGCNSIHGDFKDTLQFWHLDRIFGSEPTLDENFVNAGFGHDRIFAVQDGSDYVWIQLYHNVKAIRPMPYHVVPTLR